MARTRKEDWIRVGLELLTRLGIPPTIEELCHALEKTKGSFYHHFKDAKSFGLELLKQWTDTHTNMLIAIVESVNENAEIRHQILDQLAMNVDRDIERAIRTWAWRDDDARGFVERVDTQRMQFLEKLLIGEGLSQEQAQHITKIEYAVMVGSTHMFIDPQDLKSSYDVVMVQLRQSLSEEL